MSERFIIFNGIVFNEKNYRNILETYPLFLDDLLKLLLKENCHANFLYVTHLILNSYDLTIF